jgi:hypothetical protein
MAATLPLADLSPASRALILRGEEARRRWEAAVRTFAATQAAHQARRAYFQHLRAAR